MTEVVDLRSDTVTRPSAGMRRAMADAAVGDDVLDGDPTTRVLESRVAELLGKEAALFFPSGIMANQTGLALLAGRGEEVLLDAGAHLLHYEEGAAAALSGVQLRPFVSGGAPTPDQVRAAVAGRGRYHPLVRVLALENTHLHSGGRALAVRETHALTETARELGLSVHLDGARLWHAAVALDAPLEDLAAGADTVMVSLSKAVGAPVGSMLAGARDLMERAWRIRRRFGGAMRQSGVLAAAALYGLEQELPELPATHEMARAIGRALDAVPGVSCPQPETNVVLAEVSDGGVKIPELLSFLEKHRILMLPFGGGRIRAVTHRDVDSRGLTRVVDALDAWRHEV